ncbi:MAG TPA: ATP-binding cassette domain-containing protein [Fimbriiglobus sp.]|jgi:molybdate transport system ATP-binding protein
MPGELITMSAATFVRPGGEAALHDITWTFRDGETWAIVGPTGAGKTALVDAAAGLLRLTAGRIEWPILDAARAKGKRADWPGDAIRRVTFREDSRLFSYRGYYYQQRFEFGDDPDVPTLRAYLSSGIGSSAREVEDAAARLGVARALDLSLLKLSNGQTRRARLAKGLLAQPELLILDDPFVGLDVAGRADVDTLLGDLVRDGQRVLLVCRPDQIPAWVTHRIELDGGRVVDAGERNRGWEGAAITTPRSVPFAVPNELAEEYVAVRNVTVRHGGRTLLEGVSWTVRAGERWAVLGPNGSGKTTLLSLLCGDHPQAYSSDVRLFGTRRGSGESIWDVKRDVGFLSPEFHLYFSEPLTAFRTATTGFFDVLSDRPTSAGQDRRVRDLFEAFQILHVKDRPFATLSTGEQRLVLLARAVVKSPRLLILDEPFQVLDRVHVARLRAWLDVTLRPDQALIFVTHDVNEKPEGVTHALRLENGRVVGRGK